jgi:hypothetical protein
LARLHDAYMEIPAFQDALPENQPDAPSSWKITSKLEQYECFFNNNSERQTQLPSTPLLKAKPYPRVTVSLIMCTLLVNHMSHMLFIRNGTVSFNNCLLRPTDVLNTPKDSHMINLQFV